MVQERQHRQEVPSLPSDPLLPLAYNTHVILLSEASGSAASHWPRCTPNVCRPLLQHQREGGSLSAVAAVTSCPGWTSPEFP